jgi:hypothetical protein
MRAKILLASVIILTACTASVHAGWRIVFEGINSHMEYVPDTPSTFDDPMNPPQPVRVGVYIHNQTNIALAYKVNGQAVTHQQGNQKVNRATPGAWTHWTVSGNTNNPPVINISFDNGKNSTVSYRLDPNNSYEFRFVQGGRLDLFRK